MASRRGSDPRPADGGGFHGFLRQLIPGNWRRPLAGRTQRSLVSPAADVTSLAVRPPWWRLAARSLFGASRRAHLEAAGGHSSVDDQRGAGSRPLIPMKRPLTVRRSVLPDSPGGEHSRPPSGTRPMLGATRPVRPVTAEQRWRDAVTSVPLESPRPFPLSLRPLVTQLAGGTSRTAYTTGPATRRALSAAGALGATTGSVVHLPAPPSAHPSSIGVLAHELSHARSPVSRPRFLLQNHVGGMDADERTARAVGNEVRSAAREAAGGPGIVVRRLFDGIRLPNLPSMPSAPNLPNLPSMPGVPSMPGLPSLPGVPIMPSLPSMPNLAGLPNLPSLPGLPSVPGIPDIPGVARGLGDRVVDAASGAGNRLTDVVGGTGNRLADVTAATGNRLADTASGLGDRVAGGANAVSAGIVDALRVGGAGASSVMDAARSAGSTLENDVMQTANGVARDVAGAGDGLDATARSLLNKLESMAGGAGAAADQFANDAVGGATNQLHAFGDSAAGALAGAGDALAGEVGGLANRAVGGLSSASGVPRVWLKQILDAVRDDIANQIERVGGRNRRVF